MKPFTLFRRTTLLAGLALCGGMAFAQTPIHLTLSHNAAPGNPKAEGALHFADLVKKRSNGRITVQVAGAAQLGEDTTSLTSMRTGTLDMSVNSQGPVSAVVPEIAALGMPFLFSSLPQAWKLLDGPIGQDLAKKFEAKNLVVLAWWDNGIRQTTNNKRPITKPDDLKGLKLRTPADPPPWTCSRRWARARSRSTSPSYTSRCSRVWWTARKTPWPTSIRRNCTKSRSTFRSRATSTNRCLS